MTGELKNILKSIFKDKSRECFAIVIGWVDKINQRIAILVANQESRFNDPDYRFTGSKSTESVIKEWFTDQKDTVH